MDLFYFPTLEETSTQIHFSKEESKHISRVLRKKAGDQLQATNGMGLEATIELIEVSNYGVQGLVNETIEHPPLPYRLHIGHCPYQKQQPLRMVYRKGN